MKILLMSPSVTDDERRPDVIGTSKNKFWQKIRDKYGFAPGVSPSYGLLYLSSILKNHGHQTFYLDGNIHGISGILNFIEKNEIELVGVSTLSYNWQTAKQNIKAIKEKNPNIIIVIGGVNATCRMSKCLEESKETNIVIYGEAEETFPEVIRRIDNKEGLNGTFGTIYRENGKIVQSPPAKINDNLDSFPFPDLSVLGDDIERFRPAPMFYRGLPHASIFASRGCPFKCTFCLSEQNLRKRDPIKVVDEIEHYIDKYKVKSLTFYDETLTVHTKWLTLICNEIINRKLKINWSANVRADCVNREMIQLMKESGCWQTLFGIESGVQKNLETIQKGETVEEIREAVHLVNEAKIETLGMFMFGIPGETFHDGLETIKFACELPLNYAIFTNITPYPGSKLYEQVKNEPGYKGLENVTTPVKINYVPGSMTEEELKQLLKIAYKNFYYRPSYIFKRMMQLRNKEDLKKNFRGFLQLWN